MLTLLSVKTSAPLPRCLTQTQGVLLGPVNPGVGPWGECNWGKVKGGKVEFYVKGIDSIRCWKSILL